MLRWLIAALFLANMLAFVATRGVFWPLPAAGPLEPDLLSRQVHPGALRVTPVEQAAEQAGGGALTAPATTAEPLAASAP